MSSLNNTSSWVIVEVATNKAILETFSQKVASAINTNKYKAIPILAYLQQFNQSIK
jgi:hypothetical protein